jgi:hypothetical protein
MPPFESFRGSMRADQETPWNLMGPFTHQARLFRVAAGPWVSVLCHRKLDPSARAFDATRVRLIRAKRPAFPGARTLGPVGPRLRVI